jgi:hypothetical protein
MMVQGAANNTDDGARRSTNMAGMEEAQQVVGGRMMMRGDKTAGD